MKITWLGQAGFLFETGGVKIMVDPYLSESCKELNPAFYRRFPVDKRFLEIKPDIIILTHAHLDHTDPETLKHYLTENSKITVLASRNAWSAARKFGGDNNYVDFNTGTQFTANGITFRAVWACHSDEYAVGVVFAAEGKTYYVTGDTLYNERIFESIKVTPDVVFMPINGVGNNMNYNDACRFADRVGAKAAIPCHFGLHDEINPEALVKRKDFIIPKPFCEIKIQK